MPVLPATAKLATGKASQSRPGWPGADTWLKTWLKFKSAGMSTGGRSREGRPACPKQRDPPACHGSITSTPAFRPARRQPHRPADRRRPAVGDRLHSPTPALADRQSPRPMAKLASSPSRFRPSSPERHDPELPPSYTDQSWPRGDIRSWPCAAFSHATQACTPPVGRGNPPGTRKLAGQHPAPSRLGITTAKSFRRETSGGS